MKKYTFILLAFFTLSSQAQDVNVLIANLKKELGENPDQKRTAIIYSDLTWYYSNVSIDSAIHYGNKAISESKKLGDSTLQAQVFSDVGAVYFRKGDFPASESNYLKAYKIRKAQKDSKGVAKVNSNLANVYLYQNKNQQAMTYFLEALKYFESVDDQQSINVSKSNLGILHTKLKNYPKAILYLKDAVNYAENNNLKDRLCEFYLNLGKAYKESNDTINAILYFNKSLKNCKSVGNTKAVAIVYQSLSLIKSKQKKTAEAEVLLEESQQQNLKFNSGLDKANLQLSVARTHIKAGEFDQAYKLLSQSKKVFENENSGDDLLIAYKLLVPVFAYLKQPDSVVFYNEKYTVLNEMLLQRSTMKQTAELEAKYQTAKKEKLILEKEAEVQKKNALILMISALAFFIALIAFLIHRQHKLKNRQQEQEFQLKTAIGHIETQNKLQEQRLNISRDLHDNIGAQLTFIISSVDNIKHGFDIQNIKLNDKLKSISEFTKSTIVELRDTIWAMNNSEIDFEDLRARILNFTEKAKSVKEDIDFKFIIDEHLDQEKLSSIAGMNIYRTIQEAVNNSIKYSEASSISIHAKDLKEQIEIVIADNGKGFDRNEVEAGNGLYNMQKRIGDIQGILKIDSEISKGTSIRILINKEFLTI